jgi:hypothetical protein
LSEQLVAFVNRKLQDKVYTMPLIRNIQFTKLLKANGILREFNFRKSSTNGKIVFNVDVTDDRNNRIYFQMQKEDADWKIQQRELPAWITINETNFCELIEKEFSPSSAIDR